MSVCSYSSSSCFEKIDPRRFNMENKRKSALKTLAVAGAVLFASWLFHPVMQKIRHQCVIRPTGMSEVSAVPAFARKYKLTCTECHSAFPALNEFGREFKILGYVREAKSLDGAQEVKAEPWSQVMEQMFPWGAVVKARLLDVQNGPASRKKMRALHELELFIAGGNIAKDFSYFTELVIEDSGGFAPTAEVLQVGYHPFRFLNILAAKNSFWAMDPYQTLSNMGKLTVNRRNFATLGPVSGVSMDDAKQTVAVYGEALKEGTGSIYYSMGVSADKSDDEGEGPKDFSIRLALDSLKGVMIGGFGDFGEQDWESADSVGAKYKYTRAGVDALIELAGLNFRTAFLTLFDRNNQALASADQHNRAAYLEGFYTVKKGDLPIFVPLLRYDWYETTNKTKTISAVTAQVGTYFRPNARIYAEYRSEINTPANDPKDARWTLQAEVGF